jgi:hypothetical protein
MISAVEFGNLLLLEHIIDDHTPYEEFLLTDLCKPAAASGSLPCLESLVRKGWRLKSTACHQAALNGHFEVLKWLREKGCPWDTYTTSGAAEMGHLEILKYCLENGCPANYYAFTNAIKNGHVRCFQTLLKLHPNSISNDFVNTTATSHGQIRFLEALRRREKLVPHYNLAIRAGKIKVVKYLHKHGYEISEENYLSAVETKNLKLVQLLDEWQVPRHPDSLKKAAQGGDFSMVDHLYRTGSSLPMKEIPIEVIFHESSAILEYLDKRGFFLPDLSEIDSPSYDCFAYLCSIGFRPTALLGNTIIIGQDLKMLRLYHRYGGPLSSEMTTDTVYEGKLDHLKFLIEWGCPYDLDLYHEARNRYCSQEFMNYVRSLFVLPERKKRRNSS